VREISQAQNVKAPMMEEKALQTDKNEEQKPG
jgi:hypothetical protein